MAKVVKVEFTANMRFSIYLYIKSNYLYTDDQAIKVFAFDNDLSFQMIKNFISGKNETYLSQTDFDKICSILDPPLYIKKRWQKMYLVKSQLF